MKINLILSLTVCVLAGCATSSRVPYGGRGEYGFTFDLVVDGDRIDERLAQHYGFTPAELDFIINYDIKYRMGQDAGDEG